MSKVEAQRPSGAPIAETDKVVIRNLNFYYGQTRALKDVSFNLYKGQVTAFIGPSGCGKSTLLRVLNRMYDLYPGQRAEGEVMLDGENILSPGLDLNLLRSRVGMVFQKPTPFPMTIYDNIAFGVRLYEEAAEIGNGRAGRIGASARCAMERSQRQVERQRPQPIGGPAAALVHRAHRGDQPGSDSVRRAGLRARSDLDRQDRGTDRRIVRRLHDRDRHPQHAAGGARLPLHRLHVSGRDGRVR